MPIPNTSRNHRSRYSPSDSSASESDQLQDETVENDIREMYRPYVSQSTSNIRNRFLVGYDPSESDSQRPLARSTRDIHDGTRELLIDRFFAMNIDHGHTTRQLRTMESSRRQNSLELRYPTVAQMRRNRRSTSGRLESSEINGPHDDTNNGQNAPVLQFSLTKYTNTAKEVIHHISIYCYSLLSFFWIIIRAVCWYPVLAILLIGFRMPNILEKAYMHVLTLENEQEDPEEMLQFQEFHRNRTSFDRLNRYINQPGSNHRQDSIRSGSHNRVSHHIIRYDNDNQRQSNQALASRSTNTGAHQTSSERFPRHEIPTYGIYRSLFSQSTLENDTILDGANNVPAVTDNTFTTTTTTNDNLFSSTIFSVLNISNNHNNNPRQLINTPTMVSHQTIASAAADTDGNFPPQSYTQAAWMARLAGFPVSRTEMNSLVMNYLIVEGYHDAAVRFAREANIPIAGPQGHIAGILPDDNGTSNNTSNQADATPFEGINPNLSEAIMEYSNIPIVRSASSTVRQSSTNPETVPAPVDMERGASTTPGLHSTSADAENIGDNNLFQSTNESDNAAAAESMYNLLGGTYGLDFNKLEPSSNVSSFSTIKKPNDNHLYYYQKPHIFNLDKVRERSVIKSLILQGRVQEAIEKINDVDSQLLDVNEPLHFSLLRLQLIELIRAANNNRLAKHREKYGPNASLPANSTIADIEMIQPALDFAASHLARRAPANPKFLEHLEQTMALLCFPPDQLVPQLKELMDLKMRHRVADDVNTILLARQGVAGESNIQALVRLWGWAERELKEKENVDIPLLNPSDLVA